MGIILGLLALCVAIFFLAWIVGLLTGWWKGDDAAEIALKTTEIVAEIVTNGPP